ncbi:hypothetical protein [Methylobacter sp. YRD-M1]|nr:hypothetical protein [Methylobacter sp. YRD-M1]WAK01234.1 hypothetical protein LZ558_15550 [Methylobacter sp. YRD-M1]
MPTSSGVVKKHKPKASKASIHAGYKAFFVEISVEQIQEKTAQRRNSSGF